MTECRLFRLGAACLMLVGGGKAAAAPRRVTISLAGIGNTTGGGRALRCDASVQVETGKTSEWWIQVGDARPDKQAAWKAAGQALRCGSGARVVPAPPAAPEAGPTQAPYLVGHITTEVSTVAAASLIPEKVLQLDLSLSLRKLSGFAATGEPKYDLTEANRTFFFVENGTATLPLIVSDEKEKAELGLHEGLLEIGVTLATNEGSASYGSLSVSSDLRDAELLLDGGVVGRSASDETVLATVLAGEHDVAARDGSGHAIHRTVRVEPGRAAMISLNTAATSYAARYRLTPLGKNAQGYDEYRREADGGVVVKIPAGEFLMGNRNAERQPLEHQVYVSEFLMDKTGVSWGQFKQFARETGASLPPHEPYWGIEDDQPAVFVTWEEAQSFCTWSGGRLPTEAEREKAARGTDGRMYPWGNEAPDRERAVFRRQWGAVATDPVSSHPSGASPYGILNMGGNVWEYCSDWYDDKFYEVSPQKDPRGPSNGAARVCRGGSWDSRPAVLSTSCRNWAYRGYREGDFGFRCAMDSVREATHVEKSGS